MPENQALKYDVSIVYYIGWDKLQNIIINFVFFRVLHSFAWPSLKIFIQPIKIFYVKKSKKGIQLLKTHSFTTELALPGATK